MNVKHGLIDLIGDTPLVSLENIKKKYHLESDIYAKFERTTRQDQSRIERLNR